MILVSAQLGGERPQNGLFYMVNRCFSQISCLGGSENLILGILDGKQLFFSNQLFRRFRDLKIGYFRW